ncbi:MAG: hypothetical protein WDO74_25730 [Pseudomonadota bacterium]
MSRSQLPIGGRAEPTGVLLCHRLADLPLNQYIGVQHHFIVTDTVAAGAGHCGGGVPGHGQIDLPLSPMCINDHSSEVGDPGVTCDPVEADPACVNRELELGKPIGLWAPAFNDCQTFAADVLAVCNSHSPIADSADYASGAEGARGY